MNDFTATIFEGNSGNNSERAAAWREVLGGSTVVLKSPLPTLASVPGREATLVYEMDLKALTPEQRERLVVHLARKFGLSEQVVAADLDEIGCPILAEDVVITVHHPQRWL